MNCDIVVIGGSAGSTAPLKALLGRLPAEIPAAILIVLHMPAQGRGMLSATLGAVTAIPVRQAEDDMPVEHGRIYIAAPDAHLLLIDGVLRLGRGPRENMSRPAIDPLFRSAAVCCGSRVIGVVLSGRLGDGAAGLDAIKRCGGIAVVQDPDDALEPDMPRRALEATNVDLCAPAARLGDMILDLVHEEAAPQQELPAELVLEVAIATGDPVNSEVLRRMGQPASLSCPNCGGVLSNVDGGRPLRFRCQVGHAFTADTLAAEQESRVDEALRVALRIIEERAELVGRMAQDARQTGRHSVAEMYEARAREYRSYAETLRQAALKALLGAPALDDPV